ncbi:MAG: DUF6252 family protein [Flavobacterium sp.]
MRKIVSLLMIVGVFSSCQEDVKFNNPGFQGNKDGALWQAGDVRAHVEGGKLVIEADKTFETVTLSTGGTALGTYVLGTTDTNNLAAYVSTFNDVELEYATVAVPGPASKIEMISGGTVYNNGTAVATTGGSGSGLTVNIVVNAGVVTNIALSSRGNGYKAGDELTVVGGNGNCKFKITNVMNSNGEIEITEYDNVKMTVSGKFKFNAAKVTDTEIGGEILNFQYGEFYKVPIIP